MSPREAADLAAVILASRKYSTLAPALVRRVVAECQPRGADLRDAEHRARRKLHQIYAAFVVRAVHREAEALVSRVERQGHADPGVRADCLRLLGRHASTAERLPCLEELYGAVRVFAGPGAARILDLGCGLSPFALPWMGLSPQVAYHAVDVDTRLAKLYRRWLAALGRPGDATAADLLGEPPPSGPWDCVLLLKLLPTLERQASGASIALVRSLDTARLVISYARASLGGRRKGMDEQYEHDQTALEAACGLTCRRVELPSEVVYLCVPTAAR